MSIEENLQKIQEAIYGRDVRDAIHDAIHDCYEDGKSGAVDLIARERIDTILDLPEGSTVSNARLEDICVKEDGTKATSPGAAVREQIAEVKGEITKTNNEVTDLKSDLSQIHDVFKASYAHSGGQNYNYDFIVGTTYLIKNLSNGTVTVSYRTGGVTKTIKSDIASNEVLKYIPTESGSLRIYYNQEGNNTVTITSGGFTELSEQVTTIDKEISHLANKDKLVLTFENRGFDPATKSTATNTNRLLSGYFEAKSDGYFNVAECKGFAHRLVKFDSGLYFTSTTDDFNFDSAVSYRIEKGCFYRLNVKKTNNASISPSEFDFSTDIVYDVYESPENYIKVKSGKNLLTGNIVKSEVYMTSNGPVSNDYWSVGDKIDVSAHAGESITCNAWSASRPNTFVLNNGTLKDVVPSDGKTMTIPTDARLLIPSINTGNVPMQSAQIEFGDTITTFEEYNPIRGYIKSAGIVGMNIDSVVLPSVKGLKDSNSDFPYDSTTRVEDIYKWYDNLTKVFSSVEKVQYGTTSVPTLTSIDSKTYPMNAYVISPLEDKTNKIILASGLHGGSNDGDEMTGPSALAYWVRDFLYNYSNNSVYEEIRKHCEIVVMPVLNPWGMENKKRGNGRGVDLNRNFDDGAFVPNKPSYDDTTSGPSAFSEAESQAISRYISNNHSDAKCYIEFHTRGKGTVTRDNRWLLLYPSNFSSVSPTMYSIGDHLSSKYGGEVDVTPADAGGYLYIYCNNTLNIKGIEPECFNYYALDMETYVNSDTMLQNVDYVGTVIRHMYDDFVS